MLDNLEIGNRVYIHCRTHDKSKEVTNLLDKFGYKWNGCNSYVKLDRWHIHKEHTCYHPYDGRSCSLSTALHNRGMLLTADEFITYCNSRGDGFIAKSNSIFPDGFIYLLFIELILPIIVFIDILSFSIIPQCIRVLMLLSYFVFLPIIGVTWVSIINLYNKLNNKLKVQFGDHFLELRENNLKKNVLNLKFDDGLSVTYKKISNDSFIAIDGTTEYGDNIRDKVYGIPLIIYKYN